MRWSLIATAVLLTALLGFAFGRPEPKHSLLLPRELPPAEAAAAPPPAPPPPPPATTSGASILSLIEVGPAAVDPPAKAPTAEVPAPAPVPQVTSSPTDEMAARLQRRRLDRICLGAIRAAIVQALDRCARPQLARNPRLQGGLHVEVTVQAQPDRPYGLLSAVGVDSPNMYMPLFSGCIQSAIAAVTFPNPAHEVEMSYPYTLELEESTPEEDDAADDDDAEDGAQAS